MTNIDNDLWNDFAGWQAVSDFKEGDLSLLIDRVKRREALTEEEWQAVQAVLEAAAVGNKSWRPAHRLPARKTKLLASYIYPSVDYWIVRECWPRKKAISTAAGVVGLSARRVEQIFDEFVPRWRDNILIGRALQLYQEGVPQEEAIKRAAAAMGMEAGDVERAFANARVREIKCTYLISALLHRSA